MQAASSVRESEISFWAVRNFPEAFGACKWPNDRRSSRLWKDGIQYVNDTDEVQWHVTTSLISRVSGTGPKVVHLEATSGREGNRKNGWRLYIQIYLRVRFPCHAWRQGKSCSTASFALHLLSSSYSSDYSANLTDRRFEEPLSSKINLRWNQSLANRFRLLRYT